jgi:hypothetical protein
MLSAREGREDPQISSCCMAWNRHYRDWALKSSNRVRGSLACVPGDVVHLYHGSREDRQYVERYQIFHDNAYDPVRDVEIDPETGLYSPFPAIPLPCGLFRAEVWESFIAQTIRQVHNSPPSREANERWQNQSRLSRRSEVPEAGLPQQESNAYSWKHSQKVAFFPMASE